MDPLIKRQQAIQKAELHRIAAPYNVARNVAIIFIAQRFRRNARQTKTHSYD